MQIDIHCFIRHTVSSKADIKTHTINESPLGPLNHIHNIQYDDIQYREGQTQKGTFFLAYKL